MIGRSGEFQNSQLIAKLLKKASKDQIGESLQALTGFKEPNELLTNEDDFELIEFINVVREANEMPRSRSIEYKVTYFNTEDGKVNETMGMKSKRKKRTIVNQSGVPDFENLYNSDKNMGNNVDVSRITHD